MPKISIIIPIYNVQNYLATSVASVQNQTEADIEIILVDDGSTDQSGQLCDEYAATDPRIKVIHKENGGLSSARNAGVSAATAPYVLLLDGDDYIHGQAVERLLDVVQNHPSDLVQFHYIEVDRADMLPPLEETATITQKATTAKQAFEALYEKGGVYASGCTKLYKRELLQRVPFESVRHEDEMWCTRAFPHELTITYISDVLYGYVMREGSIIHSRFNPSRLEILTVKEERLKVLHSLGLAELENREWNSLFSTLFLLYRDAKIGKAADSVQQILAYCKTSPVMVCAHPSGKMKLFYAMMKIHQKTALNVYCLYWRLRGDL